MLCIGLDVHSGWMTVAGLDPATGECLRWDRKAKTDEIASMLRSWGYVGSRSLLTKSGKLDLDQAELPKHSARVLETARKIEDELQAAIGDVKRFEHSSQLISYAGLSPRVHQSNESCRYGRLGAWGDSGLHWLSEKL